MKDVVRANILTGRAQSELHLFGPFPGWDDSPLTAGWLAGLRVMADELQRTGCPREEVQRLHPPGVLNQQPVLSIQHEGVIYRFKGGKAGVVGQWLWSLGRGTDRPGTPGDLPPPPPQSDQLLDWQRIMCNRRSSTLEMQLRISKGDVTPLHLGASLQNFTKWALPYILLKDEKTNWAAWHDIERLERVCHTDDLEEWEKRPVQFLFNKPPQHAQIYANPPQSASYRTMDLRVWHHAYTQLDNVRFLRDDSGTPLGVYVASLLHVVRECAGGGGGGCVCPTGCSRWTYHALCMERSTRHCEAVCP